MRTTTRVHYRVTVNQPGYLPDTDAPQEPFVNRWTATTALIEECLLTAETLDATLPLPVEDISAHANYALLKGEPFTVCVGGLLHCVFPEA